MRQFNVWPVLTLMSVVFTCLKLGHVINWSWWWITLPLWALPVLLFVFFVFLSICLLIVLVGSLTSPTVPKNR